MPDDRDELVVPPVFTDALREHYRSVESFQKREARNARRLTRLSLGVNVAQALMIGGLATALAVTVPLVRILPVFLYARPDGTTEAAVMPQGLPPSLSETQQLSAVWQFTRLYEGYSAVEAGYNWGVVSAMSAKPVRDRYQADHDSANKAAPINTLGDKAVVHVEFLSMAKACDACENRYNIRFLRIVKLQGDPNPQRSLWTATVQWTTDFAGQINWKQRISYNPPGIVVTDYPGAQREDVPR